MEHKEAYPQHTGKIISNEQMWELKEK